MVYLMEIHLYNSIHTWMIWGRPYFGDYHVVTESSERRHALTT